jgi:hypothetical protein
MAFGIMRPRYNLIFILTVLCVLVPSTPTSAKDETLAELKQRVANASIADRPPLCIRISERQLDEFDRLYVAGDTETALTTLRDVPAFAELARDYAIQSHKHEKPSEIAIRKMTRKLANLKHTVAHDDQQSLQDAIDRLEQIRDDLLSAMFPNGVKK